jgi:hypothetical protein
VVPPPVLDADFPPLEPAVDAEEPEELVAPCEPPVLDAPPDAEAEAELPPLEVDATPEEPAVVAE